MKAFLSVAGPDHVEGADPVGVEARGESEEDLERERLDHHDLLVEAAAEELDELRIGRAVGLDGGVHELGVPEMNILHSRFHISDINISIKEIESRQWQEPEFGMDQQSTHRVAE